jgi:hypothetical protein
MLQNTQKFFFILFIFKLAIIIYLANKLNSPKSPISTSNYSHLFNCRKKDLKHWQTNDRLQSDYSKAAEPTTHSSRFIRALIIYFPINNFDLYNSEFKWFYRSWIEMQKYEPLRWRTDLVVFIEKIQDSNVFLFFNELNCSFSNRRESESDEPACILIEYVPLAKRKLHYHQISYSNLLSYGHVLSETNFEQFYSNIQQSLSYYVYLDSILIAFDGYEYFKKAGYDYLIRSDIDVFLTPLFAVWLPENCDDFYVGRGGYSDPFNQKRLNRIARDLGFKHAGLVNLGSTWISTPEQFKLVSYLTLTSKFLLI